MFTKRCPNFPFLILAQDRREGHGEEKRRLARERVRLAVQQLHEDWMTHAFPPELRSPYEPLLDILALPLGVTSVYFTPEAGRSVVVVEIAEQKSIDTHYEPKQAP